MKKMDENLRKSIKSTIIPKLIERLLLYMGLEIQGLEDAYLIPLGKPVDGIILYKENSERKMTTIEVKTGGSDVDDKQKEILEDTDGICIRASSLDVVLEYLKEAVDKRRIDEILDSYINSLKGTLREIKERVEAEWSN